MNIIYTHIDSRTYTVTCDLNTSENIWIFRPTYLWLMSRSLSSKLSNPRCRPKTSWSLCKIKHEKKPPLTTIHSLFNKIARKCLKDTRWNSCFGRFKTDITHDRTLGLSVNVPTEAFCPPVLFFLFAGSKSCFYTYGRIDWVRRLARFEVNLYGEVHPVSLCCWTLIRKLNPELSIKNLHVFFHYLPNKQLKLSSSHKIAKYELKRGQTSGNTRLIK